MSSRPPPPYPHIVKQNRGSGGHAYAIFLETIWLGDTAKPIVDFKSGLLNSRACALSHCLNKAETPNLQLNYSSWPSAFLPLLNPVLKIHVVL